jgi:beta-glucosidase
LDAIKEAVSDETEIIYEEEPTAKTLARRDFSFAILAVGEKPYAETPGDNLGGLVLPLNEADISLVTGNIPTLLIVVSGRPLVLEPWLLEKIDALIAAWLPGSEGGGIADVIFGDHDFKGQLPVTWFKQVEQLPLHIEVNSYDPLFPLGFGLTYKKGEISELISGATTYAEQPIHE